MSCKPDQKSLEGESWGQGRGLFSFFLVNGMMGLADSGTFTDQIITLDELTSFVKTGMQQTLSDPSFSHRQNPVFVGDENFEVAEVNDNLLAQVNGSDVVAMASPVVGKGIVEKGAEAAPAIAEADPLALFADYSYFDDFVIDSSFAELLAAKDTTALTRFFIEKLTADVQVDKLELEAKVALLEATKFEELAKDTVFMDAMAGYNRQIVMQSFWIKLPKETRQMLRLCCYWMRKHLIILSTIRTFPPC